MTISQGTNHYRTQIENINLLYEVSKILEENIDHKKAIQKALAIVSDNCNFKTLTLYLSNDNSQEVILLSSYDSLSKRIKNVFYKIGQNISKTVVENGKTQILSHLIKEKIYLDLLDNSNEIKDDYSYIAIPIKKETVCLGALCAGKIFTNDLDLEDDLKLLTIISSLLSAVVEIRKNESEKESLLLQSTNSIQQDMNRKFHKQNMIGNSQNIQEVFSQINQVRRSDATVLIRGESGTGKELVAHAIHHSSHRADQAFIRVNCAALPESVIESELFGHEKGSFTGALSMRKGRFELANGGTIFLDEIGELSQMIQIKLLRVLQEREIERVGSMDTIKIDVRIITATNRNLEDDIIKGNFREDLYYRLNVFPIHIPPLRQRKTDILLLTDYFVEKYRKKNGKSIKRITSNSIDLFQSYHWPGNVRELENVIERAVIISNDEVIHAYHLPPTLQSAESTDTSLHSTLGEALQVLEKDLIKDALKTAKGNRAFAARSLGISERIMGLRVDQYNIDCNKYKNR